MERSLYQTLYEPIRQLSRSNSQKLPIVCQNQTMVVKTRNKNTVSHYPKSGLKLLGEIVGASFKLRGWGVRQFEDRGIKKDRVQNLLSGKTDNPIPLLKLLSQYVYRVQLSDRFEIALIDLRSTYQDWVELERFAEIDCEAAIAPPKDLTIGGKIMGHLPLSLDKDLLVNSSVSPVFVRGTDGMNSPELRGVGGLIKNVLCQKGMTIEEFRSYTLFVEPEQQMRLLDIVEGRDRPNELECANLAYALRQITGDAKYEQEHLIEIAKQNTPVQNEQRHSRSH